MEIFFGESVQSYSSKTVQFSLALTDQSIIEFHLPKSDIIEAMYSIEQRLEDESTEPFKVGDRFIEKENLNYISFEGRSYTFSKE